MLTEIYGVIAVKTDTRRVVYHITSHYIYTYARTYTRIVGRKFTQLFLNTAYKSAEFMILRPYFVSSVFFTFKILAVSDYYFNFVA